MSSNDTRPVLITGPTGMQGRPTVAETLKRGIAVRALVRDPSSAESRKLAAQGAELVQGTFEDAASLDRALEGVRGVFSLQIATAEDGLLQQQALIDAARKAGVEQFVQSSVSSTGQHRSFVDWETGRWLKWYWENKERQEDKVRNAGFRHFTMVRPAMLMDNFLPYRAVWQHPELLSSGEVVTATRPEVPVAYVCATTVGAAAAVAFADPGRFHGMNMELADELIPQDRICEILSELTGKHARVAYRPYDDLVAEGRFEPIVSSQDWLNVEGYAARPAMLADYGLVPIPFADWAREHAAEFEIGTEK